MPCHETVSINRPIRKEISFNNRPEKMFHYCSGIFILFLWGHNFFPPFFRFPCLSLHSLYCPFSRIQLEVLCFPPTRILWLSQRVLRHKTLELHWRRRRGRQTGTQSLEKEWVGRSNGDTLVFFLLVTLSHVRMSQEAGIVFREKGWRTCSFTLRPRIWWRWWAPSELNGSQQPWSIC